MSLNENDVSGCDSPLADSNNGDCENLPAFLMESDNAQQQEQNQHQDQLEPLDQGENNEENNESTTLYRYRDFGSVQEDDDDVGSTAGENMDMGYLPRSSNASSSSSTVSMENLSHDSHISSSTDMVGSSSSIRVQKFPVKLYAILAQKEFHEIICWMPHGRSWKVLKPTVFESLVMPLFFEYSNYHSFNRLVNAWSFRRIGSGPDRGSYYHELFLRGKPFLQKYMRRLPKTHKKLPMRKKDEPDFYKLDKVSPLPALDDSAATPLATLQEIQQNKRKHPSLVGFRGSQTKRDEDERQDPVISGQLGQLANSLSPTTTSSVVTPPNFSPRNQTNGIMQRRLMMAGANSESGMHDMGNMGGMGGMGGMSSFMGGKANSYLNNGISGFDRNNPFDPIDPFSASASSGLDGFGNLGRGMNQLNQINQINQINQMNHLKPMNHMNQLNAMNTMNQMNQMNHMGVLGVGDNNGAGSFSGMNGGGSNLSSLMNARRMQGVMGGSGVSGGTFANGSASSLLFQQQHLRGLNGGNGFDPSQLDMLSNLDDFDNSAMMSSTSSANFGGAARNDGLLGGGVMGLGGAAGALSTSGRGNSLLFDTFNDSFNDSAGMSGFGGNMGGVGFMGTQSNFGTNGRLSPVRGGLHNQQSSPDYRNIHNGSRDNGLLNNLQNINGTNFGNNSGANFGNSNGNGHGMSLTNTNGSLQQDFLQNSTAPSSLLLSQQQQKLRNHQNSSMLSQHFQNSSNNFNTNSSRAGLQQILQLQKQQLQHHDAMAPIRSNPSNVPSASPSSLSDMQQLLYGNRAGSSNGGMLNNNIGSNGILNDFNNGRGTATGRAMAMRHQM